MFTMSSAENKPQITHRKLKNQSADHKANYIVLYF